MVVRRAARFGVSAASLRTTQLILLLLVLGSLVSACSRTALNWTPDYHMVRSGETLYSIARRYNLEPRQLASWNQLGDGSFIRAGQQLRLTPPRGVRSDGRIAEAGAPIQPAVAAPPWSWPVSGAVRESFGASPRTASGIRFAGREGEPVVAAAAGEVVYAGGGLQSYGQLLIIKHDSSWISAYGFNSALLVREGDRVASGQPVARMGRLPSGEPTLHFEIRSNGQPVNPLTQLPGR